MYPLPQFPMSLKYGGTYLFSFSQIAYTRHFEQFQFSRVPSSHASAFLKINFTHMLNAKMASECNQISTITFYRIYSQVNKDLCTFMSFPILSRHYHFVAKSLLNIHVPYLHVLDKMSFTSGHLLLGTTIYIHYFLQNTVNKFPNQIMVVVGIIKLW